MKKAKIKKMAELKKVLNFPIVLLITINSIMGTGIYFLPATGARFSGPMSLISWGIMSIIAIYISMCFAELVSMFPKAGGVYEYSKQAYGRFTSFLMGWITLIAGNVTIAMLIVGAIQYLLPYDLPLQKTLLSLMFIFLFNFIAYKGMKTSSFMLVTFAVITITAVFSLIIPGLIRLEQQNFTPFFVFPASAIFVTLYYIQETFFGWESAAFLAEETKNPEKVMPKALILGTVCIAVISFLFVATSLGSIPWQQFAQSSAPLSDLGKVHFGGLGKSIFTLWVYVAIIGAVACWVVSAPRLLLAMARDRLFLTQFATIHPKYSTPYKSIIFQTIISSLLVIVGVGAYRTLLLMLLPFVLSLYIGVLFALVLLRIKKPNLKRPFKAPAGKVGPLVIIAIIIGLLITWATHEPGTGRLITIAVSLIALGIPIYFLLELYYNPKAVRKTNNALAFLALWTENISLPKKVRTLIVQRMGNIKGKKVLEFGCAVGTLTLHLAKEIGSKGKLYATDISEKDISIVKKRVEKHGHKHVETLHDHNHHDRIHPKVPKVDVVVSVGNIGYVPNAKQILNHINKKLKMGSKICMVDYDKLFDIIPNQEWLEHDDKVKDVFKKSGFSVKVERIQSFAWKYIFITGKKVKNV